MANNVNVESSLALTRKYAELIKWVDLGESGLHIVLTTGVFFRLQSEDMGWFEAMMERLATSNELMVYGIEKFSLPCAEVE